LSRAAERAGQQPYWLRCSKDRNGNPIMGCCQFIYGGRKRYCLDSTPKA
jgi:hypothetical protein